MARLYSNENFPVPVVVALRRLGHDVLTSHEAGQTGQAIPDQQVLQRAIVERRALLTLNRRHFIRLHREIPHHSGIVVCTVDADHAGQAARIDQAISEAGNLEGKLVRVNRP